MHTIVIVAKGHVKRGAFAAWGNEVRFFANPPLGIRVCESYMRNSAISAVFDNENKALRHCIMLDHSRRRALSQGVGNVSLPYRLLFPSLACQDSMFGGLYIDGGPCFSEIYHGISVAVFRSRSSRDSPEHMMALSCMSNAR